MEDSQSRRAAHLELAEIASVLVRLDHVACVLVNANLSDVVHADEKLTAFVGVGIGVSGLATLNV